MFSVRNPLIFALLGIFFLHGFLYYLFPEQHYLSDGGGGWISYIKYISLFLALPLLIHYRFERYLLNWFVVGFGFLVITQVSSLYWVSEGNFLLVQLQMPILAYFFSGYLYNYFTIGKRGEITLFFLLIFTLVALTSELVFDGFAGAYSRSGFRGAGPFINPNNTGILVALMAIAFHEITRGSLRNIFVALISAFMLLITGSKTAMILYGVGLMLLRNNWKYVLILSVMGLPFFFMEELSLILTALEFRQMSLESGEVRMSDTVRVWESIFSAPLFGLMFGISNDSLVDNAYLDMLAYGGLIVVLPFLAIQFVSIFLSIKKKLTLISLMHFLIFLAMLTTNIPRLWPIAHLYWVIVGVSLLKAFNARKSLIFSTTR